MVEVLIVVSILALIAGAVAIFAIPHFRDAQLKTAHTDSITLMSVVEGYRLAHPEDASCPTVDDLKRNGALRPSQNVNDPWLHPYRIACDGTNIAVSSLGPDGQPGTADDIVEGAKPKESHP